MEPLAGDRCVLCGERLFSGIPQSLCGECLKEMPPYAKASAYGSYEGGLRELIHLLKYDRVRTAAPVLGRMLAEAVADLAPQFESKLPLVIPVPLHESKLRQRGFNQSELIAQSALKLKPMGLDLDLAPRLLQRKRPTETQTGLTRQQRVANMRGAFRATAPNVVAERDILLVDDVFTTGTTASECARVLRRAGAKRVWVATVARVLKAETTFVRTETEQEEVLAMRAGAC